MVTGLAGSKHFTLNPNLEVALTGKVDVHLRRHTHSSKAYDEAKCELSGVLGSQQLTESLRWQSHADSQTGSFRLWCRSAA